MRRAERERRWSLDCSVSWTTVTVSGSTVMLSAAFAVASLDTTSAGSTTSMWAVSPGAKPSGLDTVAP